MLADLHVGQLIEPLTGRKINRADVAALCANRTLLEMRRLSRKRLQAGES